MDKWEILLAIITIVGFVSAVSAPIIKLVSKVTELATVVDGMRVETGDYKKNNDNAHHDIYNQLGDHETRITVLETKEGN